MHILNSILWAILTILIALYGIKFTNKLFFPQFKINKIFKPLKNNNKKGTTPIQTLFLTLAGRIGVGSIAGVALAIYIGGPGTILWMWIITFLSAPLAYCETLLGIKYKNKKTQATYGGPSFYISTGLKKPTLAKLYAMIVIIAYLFGFIPIQSNTIVKSLEIININAHTLIGSLLALSTFIIIKKGLKAITKVTNVIVPVMTILYLIIAIYVIFINLNQISNIISIIIKSAFKIKPFLTSFIPLILIGIQRGIFSNESGLGLGAIAASASNSNNGCQSGYLQILGVYITTIIICTSTALIILLSDYTSLKLDNPNGIELALYSFKYHFQSIGPILLIIFIFLFSFSTIITGYYYCLSNLIYLNQNIKLINVITPLSVFIGSITSSSKIWSSINLLVAILGIINIYAINKLTKEIVEYHQKYDRI